MAAPGFAPLVGAINAAFGGQVAMQADLAPLATQVQLAAATAPLVTQVQLAAATAPLATQVQLAAATAAMQAQLATATAAMQAQLATATAAMQAQLAAHLSAVQALLAPVGIPAIAGAATAIVQATAAARSQNSHDRRGVAYVAVPRNDGTLPPSWHLVPGFSRLDLVEGPIAVVDTLLAEYGLPSGPPAGLFERRNALAHHLGTYSA